MSLYSYPLQTNPRLQQRLDNNEIIIFSDVISPGRTTQVVLKQLFNFYNTESNKSWDHYSTFFDVLNASGYYTAWMSNQETISVFGNMGNVLSSRCTIRNFTTVRKDHQEKRTPYDSALFPLITEFLQRRHGTSQNVAVIHLMGTHLSYRYRYPDNFSVFTALNESGTTALIRDTRAEYDNAVLYNDYVVDTIFSMFKEEEALVIYLSDHGEEVYNNPDSPYLGHAFKQFFPSILEIPFIIYPSPSFRTKHTQLINRFESSCDRPYMTDDFIHTLLDVLDIETPEFEPTRSVINSKFDSSRSRIVEFTPYHSERLRSKQSTDVNRTF